MRNSIRQGGKTAISTYSACLSPSPSTCIASSSFESPSVSPNTGCSRSHMASLMSKSVRAAAIRPRPRTACGRYPAFWRLASLRAICKPYESAKYASEIYCVRNRSLRATRVVRQRAGSTKDPRAQKPKRLVRDRGFHVANHVGNCTTRAHRDMVLEINQSKKKNHSPSEQLAPPLFRCSTDCDHTRQT